jgi:hypothetical protein
MVSEVTASCPPVCSCARKTGATASGSAHGCTFRAVVWILQTPAIFWTRIMGRKDGYQWGCDGLRARARSRGISEGVGRTLARDWYRKEQVILMHE